MFAKSRYSRSTEASVARWLTNGNDSQAKDEALDDLWAESLCEEPGGTVPTTFRRRQRGRNTIHLRIWQGVAACLMVAIGVIGAILHTRRQARSTMVQTYCAAGDTREITLPDGTEVLLNGSTAIVHPERFDSRDREVVLIGEANFKVAPDKSHPFVVKSDGVSVTALGTEFNVKAYPGTPTVESTLIEGKVKVNFGKGHEEELVLNPSEQLTYDRTSGTATVTRPHLNDVTAWQRGELVFDNATLAEILRELESRFPVDLAYNSKSLPADRYTFRFSKGTQIEEIMDVISDVTGTLNVTFDGNRCRVECNATDKNAPS